jgi:transposase
LAQLLAADFLPPVWMPDAATSALRRQVLRRAHVVRQRTRLKNQVHAILARNLMPRCPAADLFGIKGRVWLGQQDLPADERDAASALLRQLDFHAGELRLIDADLGRAALERPDVLRLMTIPGVDATVALSIVAAVGDFTRFRTPDKLVAYLGLNPRVRQSGGQPASHGRITKAGPGHARGMLVEAAWSASKAPGPLRAFCCRVRARRGMQVAAVATARKLAVLCWHLIIKEEDYAFALPSLIARKQRKLELRAAAATPGRPPANIDSVPASASARLPRTGASTSPARGQRRGKPRHRGRPYSRHLDQGEPLPRAGRDAIPSLGHRAKRRAVGDRSDQRAGPRGGLPRRRDRRGTQIQQGGELGRRAVPDHKLMAARRSRRARRLPTAPVPTTATATYITPRGPAMARCRWGAHAAIPGPARRAVPAQAPGRTPAAQPPSSSSPRRSSASETAAR